MAKTKALICPYCGDTQPVAESCRACGGLFEPLSRQATHNEMGPWFIRSEDRPFQPGCSYETLIKLIERGQITKFTILRGPTTKQFWTIARRVPGVSHLLGFCHNCDASVDVGDHGCHACGVPFGAYLDRNYLGLPEIRPMPWDPPVDEVSNQGEAAATARMMDFRRAAEPLGISSFASDQELRGGGTGSAAGGAVGTGQHFGAETATIGQRSGAGGAMPGTFVDERMGFMAAAPESPRAAVAVQSMERRVAEQQRVIRMLIGGLIVWGVVTVVGVAIVVQRMNGTAPLMPANTLPQAVKSEPLPATIQETSNQSPAGASAELKETPTQSQDVPEAPVFDVNTTYAKAIEFLGLAEDEAAGTDDRIRAYEDALKLLREVDAKAKSDERPADLADRIKNTERALSDLKLKAYFP